MSYSMVTDGFLMSGTSCSMQTCERQTRHFRHETYFICIFILLAIQSNCKSTRLGTSARFLLVVFITFLNILNEQCFVMKQQWPEVVNPCTYPTLGSCSSPNRIRILTLECLRPICSDSHPSQESSACWTCYSQTSARWDQLLLRWQRLQCSSSSSLDSFQCNSPSLPPPSPLSTPFFLPHKPPKANSH